MGRSHANDFFNSACQFSTTVNSCAAASRSRELMRKRWQERFGEK